jgi:hypothetical protein
MTVVIKTDEYGTVINHKDTFTFIANMLQAERDFGSVVFAWSDEQSSQYDILMTYKPLQFGHLQRGMNAGTDLFVAISGLGMFGFELNGAWKSAGYVGEKLGLGGSNDTTVALADLINGVCRRLEKTR